MEANQEMLDIGAWVGRQQAFAVIANKCSAAQALSLKQVKDSRSYEKLGLTWEEFCKEYAGISRGYADSLISRHEEFGEAYFRLSEVARISPESYRQIAPQVDGDTIEIEGEKLLLTQQNAPKIRAAIQALRAQLKHASRGRQWSPPEVTDLRIRLQALLDDVRRLARPDMPTVSGDALLVMADLAIVELTRLRKSIESYLHPTRPE